MLKLYIPFSYHIFNTVLQFGIIVVQSSYNQLLDKVNLNFLCLWVYAYVKKRWYNRGGSWKFHEQNVLPRNVNKVFLFKFK